MKICYRNVAVRRRQRTMATFEVAIFTTQQLYDDCSDEFYCYWCDPGYKGIEAAEDVVEEAFSHSDDHSVNVKTANSSEYIVDPPVESIHDSFRAHHPCDSSESYYRAHYNNLRDYFIDWLNGSCSDGHPTGADVRLLCSAATGGGLGGGITGVTGGAFKIAKDWSNSKYSTGDEYSVGNKVDTVLEECGHCFIDSNQDDDGDGKGHDWGMVHERQDGNGDYFYTMTPMGVTGITSKNNCYDYVHKADWDPDDPDDGWEADYSNCAQDAFVKE